MKKFKTAIVILVASVGFIACNKDDGAANNTATVQHLWNFDKEVHAVATGGTVIRDTTTGIFGDFYDFRSPGKVYRRVRAVSDTLMYSLVGIAGNRIIFSTSFSRPDTFDILLLSTSQLQFAHPSTSALAGSDKIVFLSR